MKSPDNKLDMYKRLATGEFGNTFRSWLSVANVKADGYDGLVGMRTSLKNGPWSDRNMTLAEAELIESELRANHVEFVSFMEAVPNDERVFNGELMRTSDGLWLRYGIGCEHMRASMEKPAYASNHEARLILQRYVPYDDTCWLMHLLDTYDGPAQDRSATVEFTVFAKKCGHLHEHTIIWEVRAY